MRPPCKCRGLWALVPRGDKVGWHLSKGWPQQWWVTPTSAGHIVHTELQEITTVNTNIHNNNGITSSQRVKIAPDLLSSPSPAGPRWETGRAMDHVLMDTRLGLVPPTYLGLTCVTSWPKWHQRVGKFVIKSSEWAAGFSGYSGCSVLFIQSRACVCLVSVRQEVPPDVWQVLTTWWDQRGVTRFVVITHNTTESLQAEIIWQPYYTHHNRDTALTIFLLGLL